MDSTSTIPIIKLRIVLLSTTAQYIVIIWLVTKTIVKGNLSLLDKCLTYETGPCRTPNDKKKSKEPNVQSITNFLGFNVKTGKRKNPKAKQATDPSNKRTNPMYLSNLDKVNQEGSSEAPRRSEEFRGSIFCAPSTVSWNVLLIFEPKFEKKDDAVLAKSLLLDVRVVLQLEMNAALLSSDIVCYDRNAPIHSSGILIHMVPTPRKRNLLKRSSPQALQIHCTHQANQVRKSCSPERKEWLINKKKSVEYIELYKMSRYCHYNLQIHQNIQHWLEN